MKARAEVVKQCQATLGEGAIWSQRDDSLYWVDILEGQVHVFEPATQCSHCYDIGKFVGTVVSRRAGGLLLALNRGLAIFDPASGRLDVLHDSVSDSPHHRFNDGKCDPAGRFWVGTIAMDDSTGSSALYRLDPDHTVHCVHTGITNSNGIAWSHDQNTMYFIDTPTRQVCAFNYDIGSGDIFDRRVAFTIAAGLGYPDGMTIDAAGKLWIALWGGSCVSQWDPLSGQLLATIRLPVTQVTSCAFGGTDLRQLYITTARLGLDDSAIRNEPLAGSLFCAELDVAGVPAFEFAG
jgi:sugar lactone lactonase YvrE